MLRLVPLFAALLGCSSASAPAEPPPSSDDPPPAPLDAVELPAVPDLPQDVATCVEDYRAIADAPLPARAPTQSFDGWSAGPVQGWVDHYNGVRERCDAIFATLDEDGPEAQVVLGTQSAMHQRLGQAAVPYEEQAQMFVMGRYWTLGAACTYQHCADGPLDAWSTFCRDRASMMPACPAVEPTPPPADDQEQP